jgi:DNA topoisomerase I
LGKHPESGKKVVVNIGRFGPYIQHEKDFRSVPKSDDIFTVTLERALEVLAQPKSAGRGALRDLGVHPDDGKPITVHSGRYGPYVKHSKVNATLPKDVTPEEITFDQAVNLIAARASKTSAAPARKTGKPKKATGAKLKKAA